MVIRWHHQFKLFHADFLPKGFLEAIRRVIFDKRNDPVKLVLYLMLFLYFWYYEVLS